MTSDAASCAYAALPALSEREHEVLAAIVEHVRATGASPTRRELSRVVDVTQWYMTELLARLEAKGYVTRGGGRGRRAARSLAVLFDEHGQPFASNLEHLEALRDELDAARLALEAAQSRRCAVVIGQGACPRCALRCEVTKRCRRRR